MDRLGFKDFVTSIHRSVMRIHMAVRARVSSHCSSAKS